jgi:Flp pilus assembly protein TadG
MRREFNFDEGGSAAVEFALIVPVLFTLILGIISLCNLYFSQSSLHTAAESAARYWAVSDAGWTVSGSCPTTTFTAPLNNSGATLPVSCTAGNTIGATTFLSPTAYAKKQYFGSVLTNLNYTVTTGQCAVSGNTFGGPGFIVSASGTYTFNAMFIQFPMTVATTACYPEIQ